MLPSVYRVRIVADSPDRYTVRLRVVDGRQYEVPPDGRLNIAVPAYRASCSVYLFDKIRISSGANPFTAKSVDLAEGRRVVRQLSLKEIAGLPLDAEHYHVLTVPVRR
jgi:hypothetical protein